ncbi:MauE/DoxX family redox-associated membrane protein [Bacteroidota bacterium]
MKNILHSEYLKLFTRVILAAVFIFAAAGKIADPEEFAVAISNYRMIPLFAVNFFAIIIPWIEIVAALLLLFGVSVKESSSILSLLLIIFIVMISIAVLRGLDINCGCFGTTEGSKVGLTKIGENIILLLFGIYLILFQNEDKSKFNLK